MKVTRFIGLMFIVLLLTACSSHDEGSQADKQPATISVYVYSPAKPMVTRGDIGEVSPDNTKNESLITKLQIWVFEHDTENLIAYYSPESVENLNNGNGEIYQLSASDAFAQAESKPLVDVYVAANATTDGCGLTLSETTTRAQLEAAQIGSEYFGLTTLIEQAPADGFPMSGVLHGASVTGSAPVFKIPTVSLIRAVSKVRFIFSREKGVKEVKINSITLTSGMIPTSEYLFLESDETTTPPTINTYHVGSGYVTDTKDFLNGEALTDICENDDPLAYTYQAGQEAQAYETLIDNAINNTDGTTPKPLLTAKGPYYLRESDMKLTGSISYQVQNTEDPTAWDDEKTVTFEMKAAGDFSRNHTWIVYAYYSVSGLVAVTVVLKDWNENTATPHELYNW